MAIVNVPNMFAVMAFTDPEKVGLAIKSKYPNDHLPLPGSGHWLIVTEGTSRSVSDNLGISDGSVGSAAMIVVFTSYYGRASTSIWEWIASKMRKANG